VISVSSGRSSVVSPISSSSSNSSGGIAIPGSLRVNDPVGRLLSQGEQVHHFPSFAHGVNRVTPDVTSASSSSSAILPPHSTTNDADAVPVKQDLTKVIVAEQHAISVPDPISHEVKVTKGRKRKHLVDENEGKSEETAATTQITGKRANMTRKSSLFTKKK
jgi:hypothetical protein